MNRQAVYIVLALALLMVCPVQATVQQSDELVLLAPFVPVLLHADSSDSHDVKDIDSARPMPKGYGRIGRLPLDIADSISKTDRLSVQYQTLGELLMRSTPYQPLSQGGLGQFDAISVLGSLQTNLLTSLNGRPYSSAWNNSINLSAIAVEGLETVEILVGTAAIGLAPGIGQAAMNLQKARYDSKTPHTALWYSQGGGNFIGTDVLFTQNIAKGTNINVGIRRNGAEGSYLQTDYDVWNVRLGYRYMPDSNSVLDFSYDLTSHNTDLWGGIVTGTHNPLISEFDTPVVFGSLRDLQRRHDLQLGFMTLLTRDSLHTMTAQLYYTHDNLIRLQDTVLAPDSASGVSEPVLFQGRQAGMLLRTSHQLGNTLIRVGAVTEYVQNTGNHIVDAVSEIQPQLFLHLHHTITPQLSLQAASHLKYAMSTAAYGAGAGLLWKGSVSRVLADVSYVTTLPTPAETQLGLKPENVLLALGEYAFSGKNFKVRGSLFFTSTTNMISSHLVYDSLGLAGDIRASNRQDAARMVGTILSGTVRHGLLETQATVRTHTAITGSNLLPPLSGDVQVAGIYQLGRNTITGGIHISALIPGTVLQFVPIRWMSVQPPGDDKKAVYNGIDAFITAFVGNAAIRLSWENILAERWYSTLVTPSVPSNFRLSLTWNFLD